MGTVFYNVALLDKEINRIVHVREFNHLLSPANAAELGHGDLAPITTGHMGILLIITFFHLSTQVDLIVAGLGFVTVEGDD